MPLRGELVAPFGRPTSMRTIALPSAVIAFALLSGCSSDATRDGARPEPLQATPTTSRILTTTTTTTVSTVFPASTTTALEPMGPPTVVLRPSWDVATVPLHVNVGDTIAFVAPAYETWFHQDGSVYDPDRPFASDAALLREVRYTDACPAHGTCAAWTARAAGIATVSESGPNGTVCELSTGTAELSCMGIAGQVWSQEVVIEEI